MTWGQEIEFHDIKVRNEEKTLEAEVQNQGNPR
jgi:hypothetical protein